MGWAVGKLDRKTSIFILKSDYKDILWFLKRNSLMFQPVLLGSYSMKPFSTLSI